MSEQEMERQTLSRILIGLIYVFSVFFVVGVGLWLVSKALTVVSGTLFLIMTISFWRGDKKRETDPLKPTLFPQSLIPYAVSAILLSVGLVLWVENVRVGTEERPAGAFMRAMTGEETVTVHFGDEIVRDIGKIFVAGSAPLLFALGIALVVISDQSKGA